MGFKPTVRKFLRSVCKEAFSQTRKALQFLRVIIDVLTILRHNSPSGNSMWTGIEFFNNLATTIRKELESGTQVVTICCDVQEWVPPMKDREQKTRDDGADEELEDDDYFGHERKKKKEEDAENNKPPLIPYPDDAQIVDGGIECCDFVQYQDEKNLDDQGRPIWKYRPATLSQDGEERCKVTVQKFDMFRVLKTRSTVRPRLWTYFLDRLLKIKNQVESQVDSNGRPCTYLGGGYLQKGIILDTGTGQGYSPILIISGHKQAIELTDYIHELGEADHMLGYWINICRYEDAKQGYKAHPCEIQTNDQDQNGLAVVQVAMAHPPVKQDVIWRWPDQRRHGFDPKNPYWYMDVRAVARSVLWKEMAKIDRKVMPPVGGAHHTAMTWLISCFLLGTDFVKKPKIAPGIGDETLWEFCNKKETRDLLDKVKLDMQTLREIDEAEAKASNDPKRQQRRNIWPQIPPRKKGEPAMEVVHDQYRTLDKEANMQKKPLVYKENGFIPDPHLVQFLTQLYSTHKRSKFKKPKEALEGTYDMALNLQYYLLDWDKWQKRPDPFDLHVQRIKTQNRRKQDIERAMADEKERKESAPKQLKRKLPPPPPPAAEEVKMVTSEKDSGIVNGDEDNDQPRAKRMRLGEKIMNDTSAGEAVQWMSDADELNALFA